MDAVTRELQSLAKALQRTDAYLASDELHLAGHEMCRALEGVVREAQPERRLGPIGRLRGRPVPQRLPGLLAMLRDDLTNPDYFKVAWPLQREPIERLTRLLRDPVIADTLVRFGYPPPAVEPLLDATATGLRNLAAKPPRTPPIQLFSEASAAIDELAREICQLARTQKNPRRLRQLIEQGRAVIAQILLTAVVTPAVAVAAEQFLPQAAAIIEQLRDRLGELWAVLSLGAVAAIPIIGEPQAPAESMDHPSPAPPSLAASPAAQHESQEPPPPATPAHQPGPPAGVLDQQPLGAAAPPPHGEAAQVDVWGPDPGFPATHQSAEQIQAGHDLEELARGMGVESHFGQITPVADPPDPELPDPDKIFNRSDEPDQHRPTVDPARPPDPPPTPPPPSPSPGM
jgi:hypothetical protein